jgi:hypothetical protein
MASRAPEFPLEGPPEPSCLLEGTIVALKAGLSTMLPVVGPLIAESFGGLVSYRNQQVTADWMCKLQARLDQLADAADNLRDPAKADEVCAAIVAAAQAAIRTHQEEKREALRLAVLNVATSGIEGADERTVFVRFIDELTPTHLRMLRLIADNKKGLAHVTRHSSLFDKVQEKGMGLPHRDDGFLYFRELLTRDLIHVDAEFGAQEGGGGSMQEILNQQKDRSMRYMLHHRKQMVGLSPAGERFLAFISDPRPKAQREPSEQVDSDGAPL